MIEITASDGHVFSAYRAEPVGTAKGVVVVLQEVFGVNPHIRKLTDAFAAQGFVAVAPGLFDRVQKGIELGYDEASVAQGLDLVKQVGFEHAMTDIQATVDAFSGEGKIALVGYDWGAYLAYNAANRVRGPATAVAYYGCGITDDFSQKRRIPTLLHFGSLDPYIPLNQVTILRARRPDLRILDYPAGHHFNCEERDTYDATATEKAWTTTLLHLTHRLEGAPVVTLTNQGSYVSSGGKDKDKKKKAESVSDDMGPPM
ncbi:dienelactone hydrolase family protein [Methylococcus sp. EFPC2]|uniref:dienelactone hydrolase family protein n=1 Tax=Methylococcus sp. EFPC2 TaxID=2812648 RepID=UPI0019671D8E|nr:dienelactone hydrolase family protein [Methylococcus sp. EFPC2]QSA98331.1 dienelactone hydrolase family protein [Methylococcus sp. EFPC2]